MEGRLINCVRPISLVNRKPFCVSPILHVRIKWYIGPHRGIVTGNFAYDRGSIDTFELPSQIFHTISDDFRHLFDPIFIAQEVQHLLVEDLPSEVAGLLKNNATVFSIGIISKIGSLIDEALSIGIDHDAEGVGMLLKSVANCKVAEFGSVEVPADSVAS